MVAIKAKGPKFKFPVKGKIDADLIGPLN